MRSPTLSDHQSKIGTEQVWMFTGRVCLKPLDRRIDVSMMCPYCGFHQPSHVMSLDEAEIGFKNAPENCNVSHDCNRFLQAWELFYQNSCPFPSLLAPLKNHPFDLDANQKRNVLCGCF